MDSQTMELAAIFEEMADLLDIRGDSHHRILSYRRAAENLRTLDEPVSQVWRAGRLAQIPGIGSALAEKIETYLHTGQIEAYNTLRSEVPPSLLGMLAVPGLGPRRVALFWKTLNLTKVDELEEAAHTGKLRTIKGVGPRLEKNILDGIRALRRQREGRIPLGFAWPLVQEMLAALQEVPGVVQAAPAGSLRRMQETVGDLDLLVASEESAAVMERFRRLPMVSKVLLTGPMKTSIRTVDGIQVDLRVVHPQQWGSALQYFTGSQAHNIRLRALAQQKGLSLSEYGFQGDIETIRCPDEADVYATLGLSWIPPELREDQGEIDAAIEGVLPNLVTMTDILGDFQVHTTWSDGDARIETMADAAKASGLRYLVVADHSAGRGGGSEKCVTPANVDNLLAEIKRVNTHLDASFRVLAGIEVEILEDGTLDWPSEVLAKLDFVIASLHTALNQPREQLTQRVLRAIRNPYVCLIGHPTGRVLGARPEADIDMEAVFAAAAKHHVALEVNAWPQRLDLNAGYIKRAVATGVKLAISSDAHDTEGLSVLPFGVAMARRGWAEASHILNTRPVAEIIAWCRSRVPH
ncbi:MAG: DNA polymerase/3'-5' exonuclease PolX [Anaerolineae bacterium]|nr:DNA polymerase/3'-5' exonuclease PolX [Anaerolineae bacterium]